ncbi:PepSY domain-containing protein [Streptomyces sp. NPDC047097]|uniref:PepSY domain-containing protein n=1 Tax=Streptomyces sp. NPDC047097 TaxID=3155260 RepID=UPI00340D3184
MSAPFRLRGLAAACLVVSSALLVSACGTEQERVTAAAPAQPTGTTSASPSGSASPRLTDDQAERQKLVPAAKVTWDKAAQAAVGEVQQSKLAEMELTWAPSGAEASASPSGQASGSASPSPASPSPAGPSPSGSPGAQTPVWENTVVTQDGTAHKVWVDAVSGQVIRSEQDPDQDADDKSEWAARLKAATVTPQQAVQAAQGRAKGTVTAAELDDNVWKVDIVDTGNWDKTTVGVSATDRKVVSEDVDKD